MGDEAIGLFFVGVSGAEHAAAAIRAARALLDAVGRADATESGPIPVGAAVHTGDAFVGSTGAEGAVNDFTALGDVVNTTARLASEAAAGELLVSIEAATSRATWTRPRWSIGRSASAAGPTPSRSSRCDRRERLRTPAPNEASRIVRLRMALRTGLESPVR